MSDTLARKKKLKLSFTIAITIGLIIAGFSYWRYLEIHPSTDDAYLQAHIINIAPQIGGKIIKLAVQNNQVVKQGQLLFSLDPEPYQLAVNKARAQLELDRKNAERFISLSEGGRAAKVEEDEAKAKLAVSKANLAEAELNLRYTEIKAPSAGTVTNLSLREGNVVAAGTPVFALIEANNWWVDANYKETQLKRIRAGQRAEVKVDMYSGQVFKAQVESISQGSGAAFSLLPPENASGNWVKVTQRFAVKLRLVEQDPLHPFRVGASATATVHTSE